MNPRDRLIIALDVDNESRALHFVDILKHDVKFFKIGFELFSTCGPSIVNAVKEKGCEVFLDLKYHDIPNTVGKSAAAVTRLGVYMFNLHASGGLEMMRKAREMVDEEAERLKVDPPRIIAVTVLTSMDENGLRKTGVSGSIKDHVIRLALMTKEAGLDGVVASPEEVRVIRKECGDKFLIVTPGIRPLWAATGDQKRIATPEETIKAGADFIVVGRPVLEAKDPAEAARLVLSEMGFRVGS